MLMTSPYTDIQALLADPRLADGTYEFTSTKDAIV